MNHIGEKFALLKGEPMIDEKRKNDLRDALLAVCNARHMQNYAENLRLKNVPLCGDYADKLMYCDPRLKRG